MMEASAAILAADMGTDRFQGDVNLDAIKIIASPPGDAPQGINDAWINARLPLSVPDVKSALVVRDVAVSPIVYLAHRFRRTFGTSRRERGYLVNTAAAIASLQRTNPSASNWWRENRPELLQSRHHFIFPTETCEEVTANIVSTFYDVDLSGFSSAGIFSIKTSWYNEFGIHTTGFTSVKPDHADYRLWQWITYQRETSLITNPLLSDTALNALRAAFMAIAN